MFTMISQDEDELIAFVVRHGTHILDDPEAMIGEIRYNAHVELNGSLPEILSLIKLMVFSQKMEADFFDAESKHEHFEFV